MDSKISGTRKISKPRNNVCAVEGCDEACFNEVCNEHAKKIRRGLLPPQGGIEWNPPCEIKWCGKPTASRKGTLCATHYSYRAKNGHDPRPPKQKELLRKPCTVEGCPTRTQDESGMCSTHRKQYEKWGITWTGVRPRDTIREIRNSRMPKCAVERCPARAVTVNMRLCRTHYGSRTRKGISTEYFLELVNRDECDACGAPNPTCIDHDHDCHPGEAMCPGCIRGTLCVGCNTALGHVGDSVRVLEGLIQYLGSNRTTRV